MTSPRRPTIKPVSLRSPRPGGGRRRTNRALAWLGAVAGGLVAAGVVVVIVALSLAAGDDEEGGAPTPAGAGSTPTALAMRFVTGLTPAEGASVPQVRTWSADPRAKIGVCFDAVFAGLPGSGNVAWFRLLLDGEEVTGRLAIFPDSGEAPTKMTACFNGGKALALGAHSATVLVKDPATATSPIQEQKSWSFTVVR